MVTNGSILPYITYKNLHKNVITAIIISPLILLVLVLLYNPESSHHVANNYAYNANQNEIQIPQIIGRPSEDIRGNKTFIIHTWMHGNRMKRRFLRSYGLVDRDPYEFCSVRNCKLSIDDSEVEIADAVLFHLHQTKGPQTLPKRHPDEQVWIFFTDESPYHTFYASRKYKMKDYNGFFNWSMTYRRGSDVYIPYGRKVPLSPLESSMVQDTDYAKMKNLTITLLGSNCGGQNHRWNYVAELRKHINIDVYGHCGDLKCPGTFANDCGLINEYKFYLAFENSNCREYMTEKLWWNAYHKNSVPIVMGAPKEDYEALCPPNSFIHVDDFDDPKELAEYISMLDSNATAYNQYFRWKKHFKILNEHGYFGAPSLHLCRICEKLNTKSIQPKTYTNLESFWNRKTDCSMPKWTPPPKANS